MRELQTEILVIGGGSTGTGVTWDAALRGFQTILVEKRDLTHGTTGRYHGLLHSGGRYVVKDPRSAQECIQENRILRQTHSHCIEDTGGFFVVTPEDEGDYPQRFVEACARTGIPCTELSIAAALKQEPLLNPRASRIFQVPDGAADSFLATHATAQAARLAGATLLVYHEVLSLLQTGSEGDRRVTGATVRDMASGEEILIRADMVINAAGAWAGHIAAFAGIEVKVIPGKGVMVAMNHRVVNTVLNRCKMPADGDIIVPIHTVAVIGTTDEKVSDPERLIIEPWEVALMLEEGEKLVPGISRARVLRAWAGVRPLYQEGFVGESRDATRALTLLDHRSRDGVSGFLTITGGKWTTFRLMAETTVDKACEQLGTRRICTTATTPVPGVDQKHYWLGHRLHEVEEEELQAQLICECELVTRGMIERAVQHNPTVTLDDLRRDVRLGMGPCQGGFCTFRAACILHTLAQKSARSVPAAAPDAGDRPGDSAWEVAYMQSAGHNAAFEPSESTPPVPAFDANLLLRDFLQERWKGLTPILWGQQLKQERLDELIYLNLFNADHLPSSGTASPLTDFYRYNPQPGQPLDEDAPNGAADRASEPEANDA